jgi:hypothetical protein
MGLWQRRVRILNGTFNNISVISWRSVFDGGNRCTRSNPPTCRKSLTNFYTYGDVCQIDTYNIVKIDKLCSPGKWIVMYLFVRVSIVFFSTILLLNFGTVQTVCVIYLIFHFLINWNFRASIENNEVMH